MLDILVLLIIIFLLFSHFLLSLSSTSSHDKYMIEKSNQYGIASTTINGELVRSRSEKILADYFTRNNIKYVYEPELVGIYAEPDFYLPDYDVYVEFWGLIKVSKEYEDNMRRKMAIYRQNNLRFISIYPLNLRNLDHYFPKKFKKQTGYELPENNLS